MTLNFDVNFSPWPEGATYTVVVEWGDGTSDVYSGQAGSGWTSVRVSHTYVRSMTEGLGPIRLRETWSGVQVHQSGAQYDCSGSVVGVAVSLPWESDDGPVAEEIDDVVVPDVRGLSAAESSATVRAAGLAPLEGAPQEVPGIAGICRTWSQDPLPGATVRRGSPVIFSVGRTLTPEAQTLVDELNQAMLGVDPRGLAWEGLQEGSRDFLEDYLLRSMQERAIEDTNASATRIRELLEDYIEVLDSPGDHPELFAPPYLLEPDETFEVLKTHRRAAKVALVTMKIIDIVGKARAPFDLVGSWNDASDEQLALLEALGAMIMRTSAEWQEAMARCEAS